MQVIETFPFQYTLYLALPSVEEELGANVNTLLVAFVFQEKYTIRSSNINLARTFVYLRTFLYPSLEHQVHIQIVKGNGFILTVT